jgi:DNA-binding beta-propeller fold protein YncE
MYYCDLTGVNKSGVKRDSWDARSRVGRAFGGATMTGGVRQAILALACLAVLSSCSPGGPDPLHPPLTAEGNIQLPKEHDKPAFDLLTLDPRNGRLYVAHSSADFLEVVDTRTRRLTGRVGRLSNIKGIALTSDPNIVFTSDADGTVAIVDVTNLKVMKKLDLGGAPDAIAYDPVHDVVAVSLSSDKKVAFIDAKTQMPVGTLPLPGSPELMTVDDRTGSIYLAIHDLDEVVIIDTPSRSITTTFKGCDINKPTGLAYDGERGLLFVASSGELSIIDVVIDRCLGGVDIGHGTDQIAFNPHRHHVYTADGGSRYVSVVDTQSLKPLGTVGTGPGAATIAADPTSDLVFVMVPRAGIVAVYHDP